MTRLLFAALCVVLLTAVLSVVRHPHTLAAASSPRVVASRPAQATLLSTVVTPNRHRGVALRRTTTCTDQHWKRTLHPAERWIDLHESTLNPASREPTTGAYGLGQLLPETYRNLGLVESASPCAQITAQRRYAVERYGSWANAKAFWEANLWW